MSHVACRRLPCVNAVSCAAARLLVPRVQLHSVPASAGAPPGKVRTCPLACHLQDLYAQGHDVTRHGQLCQKWTETEASHAAWCTQTQASTPRNAPPVTLQRQRPCQDQSSCARPRHFQRTQAAQSLCASITDVFCRRMTISAHKSSYLKKFKSTKVSVLPTFVLPNDNLGQHRHKGCGRMCRIDERQHASPGSLHACDGSISGEGTV